MARTEAAKPKRLRQKRSQSESALKKKQVPKVSLELNPFEATPAEAAVEKPKDWVDFADDGSYTVQRSQSVPLAMRTPSVAVEDVPEAVPEEGSDAGSDDFLDGVSSDEEAEDPTLHNPFAQAKADPPSPSANPFSTAEEGTSCDKYLT